MKQAVWYIVLVGVVLAALSLAEYGYAGRQAVAAALSTGSVAGVGADSPARLAAAVPTAVKAMTSKMPDASGEYRLGPENVLQIDVYYGRGERISQKVRVSSIGTINFPLAGEVVAAGLTVADFQNYLERELAEKYLVNPQVIVFIEEYSTVSIKGEVQSPGVYALRGQITIGELIAQAQGVTEKAAVDMVRLIRRQPDGSRQSAIMRLTAAAESYETVLLQADDMIVVEPAGLVAVLGHVKTPGAYALRRPLSIVDVVSHAGGVLDAAASYRYRVMRRPDSGTSEEIVINLSNTVELVHNTSLLRAGDVLFVDQYGVVTITGEVQAPGVYPLKERMNVLELIAQARGVTRQAAVDRVKITRRLPDGASEQRIVRLYDYMGYPEQRNVLVDGDIVLVEEQGTVSIMGEVTRPGVYPLREGITVLDAICLAEGFTKFAAKNRVKVFRHDAVSGKQEIQVRINDLINKSYVESENIVLRANDLIVVPDGMF